MPYGQLSWKTKQDGYVTVDNDAELVAVLNNCTNTPWEISAYTGGMIVPQWVLDAVKQYKDNGGYAGLALFEYLDKVSGDREAEPKHTF